MCMRRKTDAKEYNTRFRYKLNMLEPGYIMMKIVFVLALIGVITCIAGYTAIGRILFIVAGCILAILFILVKIELYQDRVLNEIAEREHKNEK